MPRRLTRDQRRIEAEKQVGRADTRIRLANKTLDAEWKRIVKYHNLAFAEVLASCFIEHMRVLHELAIPSSRRYSAPLLLPCSALRNTRNVEVWFLATFACM